MSDFASLLGQLKRTADVAASSSSAATTSSSRDDANRKRRRRANDDSYDNERAAKGREVQKSPMPMPMPTRLPRDHHQLGIRISFLVIGAQKAGTSWLHDVLGRHPSVTLPKPPTKEVHFWDWHRRRGLGWYTRQFPKPANASDCSRAVVDGADDGRRRRRGDDGASGGSSCFGEITPCYAVLPERDVCEIKSLFPELRVVFVARDLVDRAWSAVLMELRNAVRGMDPGEFAKNDLGPAAAAAGGGERDRRSRIGEEEDADPSKYDDEYFMDRVGHSSHRSRSDYAAGLRTWLRYFPREQILILDYREIEADPKRFLGKVCDHLGVEGEKLLDSLSDEDLRRRINAATRPGGSSSSVSSSKSTGAASGATALRPSLRRRMEGYLRPMARDFNALLGELGYEWSLDEYTTGATGR